MPSSRRLRAAWLCAALIAPACGLVGNGEPEMSTFAGEGFKVSYPTDWWVCEIVEGGPDGIDVVGTTEVGGEPPLIQVGSTQGDFPDVESATLALRAITDLPGYEERRRMTVDVEGATQAILVEYSHPSFIPDESGDPHRIRGRVLFATDDDGRLVTAFARALDEEFGAQRKVFSDVTRSLRLGDYEQRRELEECTFEPIPVVTP